MPSRSVLHVIESSWFFKKPKAIRTIIAHSNPLIIQTEFVYDVPRLLRKVVDYVFYLPMEFYSDHEREVLCEWGYDTMLRFPSHTLWYVFDKRKNEWFVLNHDPDQQVRQFHAKCSRDICTDDSKQWYQDLKKYLRTNDCSALRIMVDVIIQCLFIGETAHACCDYKCYIPPLPRCAINFFSKENFAD